MKYTLSVLTILTLLLKVNSKETHKVACSPDIQDLGYECCDAPCTIEHTDEHGFWGEQNGKKCGCGEPIANLNEIKKCDKKYKEMGYECCDNCFIFEINGDGNIWGINTKKDGKQEWCGISDYCMRYF